MCGVFVCVCVCDDMFVVDSHRVRGELLAPMTDPPGGRGGVLEISGIKRFITQNQWD